MILTSTTTLSIWGGWCQSHPRLGSCDRFPSLQCQPTHPPPDLPLTPKSSIDCPPQAPNRNLPIDINFDVNSVLVSHHKLFWGPSRVFVHNNFKSLTVHTHREYVSNFTLYNIMGSLNLTPFTWNPIRDLFPVTRIHSQFTPLSYLLLNLWGTMSYVFI